MKDVIYSVTTDFGGLFDIGKFDAEVKGNPSITTLCHGVGCGGNLVRVHFEDDLPPGQKTILDGLVAAHAVDALKKEKKRIVKILDANTEILIEDLGFEWPPASGKKFSTSKNAQTKWLGLLVGKDMASYPVKVPTKKDDEVYPIADSGEVINMYATAMGAVKSILDQSVIIKEEIIVSAGMSELQSRMTAQKAANQTRADLLSGA